jgi:hypothetical protein
MVRRRRRFKILCVQNELVNQKVFNDRFKRTFNPCKNMLRTDDLSLVYIMKNFDL